MAEKKRNFEDNLKNLEEIVEKLENGEVSLDEAMEKFNEAMKLAKLCDESLKKAEDNINLILKDGELKEFKGEE